MKSREVVLSTDGQMDKENVVHTYNGYYSVIIKMVSCHLQQYGWKSEIRQRKANTIWFHLFVESTKQNKGTDKTETNS